jgi:hypothetical protein
MLTESDATLRVMQDVYVEEANDTHDHDRDRRATGGRRRPPDRVAARGRRSSGAARCAHRNARWSRLAIACVTGSCLQVLQRRIASIAPAWELRDE